MEIAESEEIHWNCYWLLPLIITAIIISSPCQTTGGQKNNSQFILIADTDYASLEPDELLSLINSLAKETPLSPINIIEPLPDTVLPPDMASPVFLWEDKAKTTAWLITIEINNIVFLKGTV